MQDVLQNIVAQSTASRYKMNVEEEEASDSAKSLEISSVPSARFSTEGAHMQ